MPSRMIDFDALWASDKLAACKESTRVEYTWFYGLADSYGCFEINIAAIHSRVSSIRPKLSAARIAAILEEFHQNGLLFIWNADKKYGFWTGSDKKGRLPPEGTRHRYKRFAPDVPNEELTAYTSRFRRDSVAITSRQGVGVGVGVGLDWIGYGLDKDTGLGLGQATATPAAKTAALASPDSLPATPTATSTTSNPKSPDTKKPKPQNTKKTGNSSCKLCEQTFASAEDFMKHECDAKVAGGWECVHCHSTFSSNRALKDHLPGCFRNQPFQ